MKKVFKMLGQATLIHILMDFGFHKWILSHLVITTVDNDSWPNNRFTKMSVANIFQSKKVKITLSLA